MSASYWQQMSLYTCERIKICLDMPHLCDRFCVDQRYYLASWSLMQPSLTYTSAAGKCAMPSRITPSDHSDSNLQFLWLFGTCLYLRDVIWLKLLTYVVWLRPTQLGAPYHGGCVVQRLSHSWTRGIRCSTRCLNVQRCAQNLWIVVNLSI